jgi:hypothetical protein
MRPRRPFRTPRKCIFCERGNLSKEHFWPEWAADHLRDSSARKETLEITSKGAAEQTQTVSRPGSLKHKKLRLVCQLCNNEWMSVIENDAKRVVLPMLLGQSLFLEENAQRLLARWIALKVMVVDQSRSEHAIIGLEERKAFMQQGVMPDHLQIELARCGQSPWDLAMARRTANLFPMEKRPKDLIGAAHRQNIQTTTFGIGQLVVHGRLHLGPFGGVQLPLAHDPAQRLHVEAFVLRDIVGGADVGVRAPSILFSFSMCSTTAGSCALVMVRFLPSLGSAGRFLDRAASQRRPAPRDARRWRRWPRP